MMGQSLATRAVSGGSKSYSLSDEALEALQSGDVAALLASHKSRFGGFTMLGEDDQDEDDDDDTSGDDDGDESDDDDDDEEDGDDKSKSKSKESRRIKELSDENARWRVKYRNRGKRITELETEVAELKKGKPASKKKDEDEDDASGAAEDSELKTENEKLKEKLVTQSIRMEFNDLVTGSDALAKFKNPKTAFKLLDLSEVEIDEDGDITGLDDAIKALAKSDPYLLDKGKDEDDEDDEGSGSTGQPTGRKRGKGNPNRDKLLDKYPALRR